MEDNRKKICEDNQRSISSISAKLETTQTELAKHKLDTKMEFLQLQKSIDNIMQKKDVSGTSSSYAKSGHGWH